MTEEQDEMAMPSDDAPYIEPLKAHVDPTENL